MYHMPLSKLWLAFWHGSVIQFHWWISQIAHEYTGLLLIHCFVIIMLCAISAAFFSHYFLYWFMTLFSILFYFSEIEIFALFVACLCHDIDHRGTNNSFQLESVSNIMLMKQQAFMSWPSGTHFGWSVNFCSFNMRLLLFHSMNMNPLFVTTHFQHAFPYFTPKYVMSVLIFWEVKLHWTSQNFEVWTITNG